MVGKPSYNFGLDFQKTMPIDVPVRNNSGVNDRCEGECEVLSVAF